MLVGIHGDYVGKGLTEVFAESPKGGLQDVARAKKS